ncbi:MAG: carboxypeptidase regulatory-like domain-containing protein [Bacteroidales bacterium]|nr:carboxypeptidase regulatory-like domain-containing protein [Candidatus Colimorpha onthohippi]
MKKILIMVALMALFVACDKVEFDNFSTISGTIVDAVDQSPIYDVAVTLSPSGKSTRTDGGGYFEFAELDEMQYTITATKSGYSTERRSITAIAGETSNIVIPMGKN